MTTPDTVTPACPYFGTCGGCDYQNIPYDEQCALKDGAIRSRFREIGIADALIDPIVPSDDRFHYRHRLDLSLWRLKDEGIKIGFAAQNGRETVVVDQCPIAMREVSEFIPQLREEATQALPDKYRQANLTVRAGEDGRVLWGGIGRKSNRLKPEDYLFHTVAGKIIFFSLETFFQANIGILDKVIAKIQSFDFMNKDTRLFDLYGGVGLFSFTLFDNVREVTLIESDKNAVRCARHNQTFHQADNVTILEGPVEKRLPETGDAAADAASVGLIDPPRAGLSKQTRDLLNANKRFPVLMYLSCHPDTLMRDVKDFVQNGWEVASVTPFDFFPQTRHIETLVVFRPSGG